MDLEKEFLDFKDSILQYVAGLREWQSNTVLYRVGQKELTDKILAEIKSMKDLCMNRGVDYALMKQHLSSSEKEKDSKSLWRKNKVLFFMGLGQAIFLALFTLFLNHLSKK